MSDIKDSIWEQNEEGKWNLFFNIEDPEFSKQFLSSQKDNETKTKKKNIVLPDKLVLGTQVMTPDGIGRLIKIEEPFGYIIKNKEEKTEIKYDLKNLSTSFNCLITILSQNSIEETIRLRLKTTMKVEDIFSILEKAKKIKRVEGNTYNLIFKGNKLKNDFNLEQINDIKNNCKILLIQEENLRYSVNRFKGTNTYWSVGGEDGITLSVSKRIRLIGVGVYGSHEGKKLVGEIKVLEGETDSSPIIYQQDTSILPATSKDEPIIPINFDKPVRLNPGQKYTVKLINKNFSSVYSGRDGKAIIEGEGEVSFSFFQCKGRNVGTNANVGNFPEFYYYLN